MRVGVKVANAENNIQSAQTHGGRVPNEGLRHTVAVCLSPSLATSQAKTKHKRPDLLTFIQLRTASMIYQTMQD